MGTWKATILVAAVGFVALLCLLITVYLGAGIPITSQAVPPSAPDPLRSTSDLTWAWLAISALAMLCLVSISITFYLYRWRRILLSNPHMVVPEEFGIWTGKIVDHLHHLAIEINRFSSPLASTLNEFRSTSEAAHSNSSSVLNAFLVMQKTLDARDEEIARLKKGYDSTVYRKFVGRFIRVDHALGDLEQSPTLERHHLMDVRRLLADALEESGVERFSPVVGEDYRTAFGVAPHPNLVPTLDVTQDQKISCVEEAGFLLRGLSEKEVIIPARVSIFIAQGKAA